MRITESKLRKVIRKTINEMTSPSSGDVGRDQVDQLFGYLCDEVAEALPKNFSQEQEESLFSLGHGPLYEVAECLMQLKGLAEKLRAAKSCIQKIESIEDSFEQGELSRQFPGQSDGYEVANVIDDFKNQYIEEFAGLMRNDLMKR